MGTYKNSKLLDLKDITYSYVYLTAKSKYRIFEFYEKRRSLRHH